MEQSQKQVSYQEFINKDLIHFSNYDCKRSIPSMCDGLKPSQRKILYGAFKRNLKREIKVAQLAGYVSEKCAYHHGEKSLLDCIVGMAQDFIGSNNINLLNPSGQFGCLAPETLIMLWNGKVKRADEINIGDQLVGDDGRSRTVLRTVAGEDDMFRVHQMNGDPYIVNSIHILTLRYLSHKILIHNVIGKFFLVNYFDDNEKTVKVEVFRYKNNEKEGLDRAFNFRNSISDNNIFDISIKDYFKLHETYRKQFISVRNEIVIEWDRKDLPINPYVFGLRMLDQNKDIPLNYIVNDKHSRLALLGGFIDGISQSDEKYVINITSNNEYLEIIRHSDIDFVFMTMINKMKFVANSLGYKSLVSQNDKVAVINFCGNNLEDIPTNIFKKTEYKCEFEKPNFDYGIRVEPIGRGKYNGWYLDGNERFLLDDFTVTHNTRLVGGKDSASPRYIYTCLEPITTLLFNTLDRPLYNREEDDDGNLVEPKWYLPIIPMILVNGGEGIGTGYSTNMPSFNPLEIVNNIKNIINDVPVKKMAPWYRGFCGDIYYDYDKKTYCSKGSYKFLDDNTIEITELTVGNWSTTY